MTTRMKQSTPTANQGDLNKGYDFNMYRDCSSYYKHDQRHQDTNSTYSNHVPALHSYDGSSTVHSTSRNEPTESEAGDVVLPTSSDTEQEDSILTENVEDDMNNLVISMIRTLFHTDGAQWRSNSWIMRHDSEDLKLRIRSFFEAMDLGPGFKDGWLETAQRCYIAPQDFAVTDSLYARPKDFYPSWFSPQATEPQNYSHPYVAGLVNGLHGLDGFGVAQFGTNRSRTGCTLEICCYPQYTYYRWNFKFNEDSPSDMDTVGLSYPRTWRERLIDDYISIITPSGRHETLAQQPPQSTDEHSKPQPENNDRNILSYLKTIEAESAHNSTHPINEEDINSKTLSIGNANQKKRSSDATDHLATQQVEPNEPVVTKAKKKREAQRQRRSRKRAENRERKKSELEEKNNAVKITPYTLWWLFILSSRILLPDVPENLEIARQRSKDKDVELVMSQVDVTRDAAAKALEANDGDIVNAIMSLSL